MGIISYSQNFEDVILWRALKDVKQGFYIDIGAQDPLIDSVSLAFYEHGWRGVHVEPTQQYVDKLRVARPDELVLKRAIGSQEGSLCFYEFADTGLSTADPDAARRHQAAGFSCNKTSIPVISLDKLFEWIHVQDVHWLKIDVEGLERAVLESWKSDSLLPWVLVIESTRPLTQDQCNDEWEQLVYNKGYKCAYFDGLNRYYLSPYHIDLISAFRSPPNVFDGFVLSGTASHSFCQLVDSKAQAAEIKAQEAERRAQEAETRAAAFHLELTAVYQSAAWRVISPITRLLDSLKKCKSLISKGSLYPLFGKCLSSTIIWVNRYSRIRSTCRVLARKTGLIQILRKYHASSARANAQFMRNVVYIPENIQDFTPRARNIYADLRNVDSRIKRIQK